MKRLILSVMAALLLTFAPGVAIGAVAADCGSGNSTNGQVLQGIGDTGSDCSGSKVNSTLSEVVNILSFIVGIAAVIMIIVGGFKFITAAGDSSKAAGARSTVAYALIGVAIAALAQVLVHFVLTASAGNPPKKKSLASPVVTPIVTQAPLQSNLTTLTGLSLEP